MTSNVIEQAGHMAADGAVEQALALLGAAAESGNADAAMLLATWYLGGKIVGRDFDRAGMWLRQAVTIGHVDAALAEIALVGNGFGGRVKANWTKAHALLVQAAHSDSVAKQYLDLLSNMDLTADGRAKTLPKTHILRESPRILYFEKLLTRVECAHVATVGSSLLEPAQILDPVTGQPMPHVVRTSDGGAIGPMREDLPIQAINHRIAAASETDVRNGEPLTVLRYRPGQQYRAHLDTIAGATNQRVRTILLYLNQGFHGGETKFPALGLSIIPQLGDALIFDTTLADGRPDQRTIHTGEPLQGGTKWLASRWVREHVYDPWR